MTQTELEDAQDKVELYLYQHKLGADAEIERLKRDNANMRILLEASRRVGHPRCVCGLCGKGTQKVMSAGVGR